MSVERRIQLTNLAVNSYNEYSILPLAVTLKNFDKDNPVSLKSFAQKFRMPEGWDQPNFISEPVFQDMGRNMGLSEKKFLTDSLGDLDIPSTVLDSLTLDNIRIAVKTLIEKDHTPSALILPLQLMNTFYSWDTTGQLIKYGPGESFLIEGMKLPLIWSNKFMPFRRAYVISRDYGTWTASPSINQRFQISFGREDTSDTVTAKTSFNFKEENVEAVVVYDLPRLPPLEF